MVEAARHDSWQAGDSYDLYMGRWSRQVAPKFLEWLGAPAGAEWMEVGCGTGALSAAILARCDPKSIVAIDPSEGFVAKAKQNVPDARVRFAVGDAQALSEPSASKDAIVAALVLNFVPDKGKALAEMKRVGRPGARVGFYVWDYPNRGIQFMRAFWDVAASLDSRVVDLTENTRFPFCTEAGLTDLAAKAGLDAIACTAIEVPTVFKDFDDLWRPFTLGAGPAPGYCVSLDPAARERLRDKLQASLPPAADGSIALSARAWAVKASA